MDEVGAPVRDALDRWAEGAPLYSFRERVSYGLQCTACLSVWVSLGVLALAFFPLGRLVILLFAVAQLALFANKLQEWKEEE